jgi:cytidine deaminase
MEPHDLLKQAKMAGQNSHSPYSKFPVGAALLTTSGKVYTGCNIESSSYGLTTCAERVAIYKAISEGESEFKAIAVTSEKKDYCPPCGACRQVLWDLAKDIDVILGIKKDEIEIVKLSQLLPKAFDEGFLSNE